MWNPAPLLWLLAPPGGPLQPRCFSRSRRHRRHKSVHRETSDDFPMNQTGPQICGTKGDRVLIIYPASLSIFSTSIKAGNDLVLLLKASLGMMHSLTLISFLSLHIHYTAKPVSSPFIHWNFFFPLFCFHHGRMLVYLQPVMYLHPYHANIPVSYG